MLYYCISACSPLAASPLRLDSSGLLWTPHRSQHLNRELHEARGRPCTARFLFSISIPISILQTCKFASRDSAERIPAVAAQAHNRNPRLVIFYLSLHYFISQTQTLKLSTLNAQ